MLIIGHRGAAAYEAENSLISFQKAIELKVDMIEFDIQKCKSGELVVFHDYTLERCTNGIGFIANKTLSELKALRLPNNQKIPTLEETLNLIDAQTKVNIELKGLSTTKELSEILTSFTEKTKWEADDFLISSFHHKELFKFQKLMSNQKLSPLYEEITHDYLEIAKALNAHSINANFKFLNRKIVEEIHNNGYQVFAYTVNKMADKHRMKEIGVDGIFTDSP